MKSSNKSRPDSRSRKPSRHSAPKKTGGRPPARGTGSSRPAGAGGGRVAVGASKAAAPTSRAPRAEFDRPVGNPKERREGYIPEPKGGRLVMGQHAINEVLSVRPGAIAGLILRERWESSEDLRDLEEKCRERKVKIEVRPDVVMDRVGSHQGAMLLVNGIPELDLDTLKAKEKASLLVLDGVEDPHNLGAILRTAWLMGVSACVIPEDRAVGLTPVVHKVASGGVEHVPVMRVQNFNNLFTELKEQGFWIFGLSHESKSTVFDLKIPEKVVWVLGAEDKGMRTTTERLCDELVRIPQISVDASYNVSVSAAIALTESFRQQSLIA